MEFGALAQFLDNDMLDNLISVVVVILVLSLLVQAIQMFIKKLFRLKSRQLEESLIDLFAATLKSEPKKTQPATGVLQNVLLWGRRFLWWLMPNRAKKERGTPHLALYEEVIKEFGRLGRVTVRGNSTLESLSKEDLLRIVARIGAERLAPDTFAAAEKLVVAAEQLRASLAAIDRASLPAGPAARLAEVEALLAPTVRTVQAITKDGQLNRAVLVAELVSLTGGDLDKALSALAELQETLSFEAGDEAIVALRKAIADVRANVSAARQSIDGVLGPLQGKLAAIREWFDTVMQSFSERYERTMRTWSILISIFVVVWLNANVFTIYTTVAKNALLRSNLSKVGERLLEEQEKIEAAEAKQKEQAKDAKADTAKSEIKTDDLKDTARIDTSEARSSASAEQPSAGTNDDLTGVSKGVTADTDSTADTASGGTGKDPIADIKESEAKIRELVDLYAGFGFEPLSVEQMNLWRSGLFSFGEIDGLSWGDRRVNDVKTLFGWLVMVLLLSVGAPFWHDVLESLFGVKNYLRQRTSRRNVEQESGAGNTKS